MVCQRQLFSSTDSLSYTGYFLLNKTLVVQWDELRCVFMHSMQPMLPDNLQSVSSLVMTLTCFVKDSNFLQWIRCLQGIRKDINCPMGWIEIYLMHFKIKIHNIKSSIFATKSINYIELLFKNLVVVSS